MIYFDLETRSEVDLSKVGAWNYSRHPSTEVMCMAHKEGSRDTLLWLPIDEKPRWLAESSRMAHYSWFEWCMWVNNLVPKHGFPEAPIDLWYCSASWAASYNIPRSLDGAGAAMNLDVQKDKAGHALMMKMCRPTKGWADFMDSVHDPISLTPKKWHEDPEDLNKLYVYCIRDVDTLYGIAQKLYAVSRRIKADAFVGLDPNMGERKVWLLDHEINTRGIPFDLEQARCSVDLMTEGLNDVNAELAAITDGEITSVGQVARIKKFCGLKNTQKKTVAKGIEKLTGPKKRALEIRRDYGKAAVSKYTSGINQADEHGSIKGTGIYHGASTGRWTSWGFQPLNLFKSEFPHRDIVDIAIPAIKRRDTDTLDTFFDSTPAALASSLRAGICAPDGYELICADYSGIEAIGSAWLVDDKEDLELFRRGDDPYRPLAAQIFKKPIGQVTKKERNLGKITRLGAQYGMGQSKDNPKFQETCKNWGFPVDYDFAHYIIYDVFRPRYDNIVEYWYRLNDGAIESLKVRRPVKCGKVTWWFNRKDDFLHLRLPSGRCLSYANPRLGTNRFGGECVTFMNIDSRTKKWTRRDFYGGLELENVDQGMCRDLMVNGMMNAEAKGYKTILTVYDEVIAMVPEGFGSLDEFCALLGKPAEWAPDCPVRATGWRGKHYRKD